VLITSRFLLAALHLDSLMGKTTESEVRTALKNLPTGSSAYDQAYEDVMKRITAQDVDGKRLAKHALSWITCARRPLTTAELQHAIAIKPGEFHFDIGNQADVEDIVSVCAGLVTVDEKSNIIRLVHYTTQEYFERNRSHWFPNAENNITTICITYLSFDVFQSGFCHTNDEFEARVRSNRFFDYAAKQWGYHARRLSNLNVELGQAAMAFLKSEAKVDAAIQGCMANKEHSFKETYSQQVPRQMTGLHLLAWFGVDLILKMMLDEGELRTFVNSKDSISRTPLWLAASKGYASVVMCLLAIDNIDIDSQDAFSRTPLFEAVKNGDATVVKLLLETGKTDYNWKDLSDKTPLYVAAQKGYETVVRLLLHIDKVDVDSKGGYGQTPLYVACAEGHETIVKLLLETGMVDINAKDGSGRSSLSVASENGNKIVVQMLLDSSKVDIDSKDESDQTPLWLAVKYGNEAVVKLLLDTGKVNVDSKDIYGQTPLSLAAATGNKTIVRLLLDTSKTDIDSKNSQGQTPLSLAAANGNVVVVKMLLATSKADVNTKDMYDQTPLSLATTNGNVAVIEFLLGTGKVDVNTKDICGQTPLEIAAAIGDTSVVKLLRETDKTEIDTENEESD
jgi:ankyrin repeat protein